jgi:mono/diheme cytochrome c family protein
MRKCFSIFAIAVAITSVLAFQQKPKFDLKASIARGKEIYSAQCMTCHMEQGEGVEDVFPPVAKSDYLMADKARSISQIIHGASGEMKVNGKVYNNVMTAFDLNDQEVSDVLNYIRNSWTNKGAAVTPEEVNAVRKKQ